MSPVLRVALALVRGWTRLYTAWMDPALRDRRRAEIESDLWEFHEDARHRYFSPSAIGVLMLLRLVPGIADDVSWRVEHRAPRVDIVQQALWATAVASVVILWSVMSALQTKEQPLSPVGTGTIVRLLYPVHMYPAPPPRPPKP